MRALWRWIALACIAFVALQLFFIGRIVLMAVVDPQSTSFQRSELWRIAHERGRMHWSQQWVPYARISDNLKRAVIASEDDNFLNHDGVDWDAIEKAWERNQRAEARAEKLQSQLERQAERRAAAGKPVAAPKPVVAKIVGGSTITQQLAKNLFLSGERSLPRKGQEFVITFMLEALLSKERILEIYLNNVEWGEGVFGAEAAAHHYFRKPASRLTPYEAARLVVMLPAPKRFEKTPGSAYLSGRASTIAARMRDAELP